MQECTKNKQGKIGTNCQIGSFGTILVCTNYPMTIHNKVVHQLYQGSDRISFFTQILHGNALFS